MISTIFFGISFVSGQLLTLVAPHIRWSLLDVFAVSMTILWCIVRIGQTSKRKEGKLLGWIIGFGIVSFVTHAIRFFVHPASGIADNIIYIARWMAYAGIYAYILHDSGTAGSWRMTLYGSGVLLAIAGLIQVFGYPDLRNLFYLGWDPHYRRVFSTLFDPNFAGIIYALTFILGLSLEKHATKNSWWHIASQICVFGALVLTYSRSSLLGFVVGIVLWFVPRRSFVPLLKIVCVGVIALFLVPRGWEGQRMFRATSSLARLGSARAGWNQFMESPIVGQGFVVAESPAPIASLPASRAGSVDMSLLYVLASCGIVGFFTYALLLQKIGALGIAAAKHQKSDGLFISSLGAVFVHSLFTNSLLYPWVMAWVWVLAALTERELVSNERKPRID